ncbi:uncharacterized protein LOC110989395 isoform X2 [Acanthaster planci]|uniref:Uncharacterized protein LOC110989395 isoform X2 n=1 Tax=Acanthaster planci TaxID=133434 RepID=A0A8B7ZWI6_ACAPL|nr:uncharacterized protein LOC110989395 isoform X2 [Acanthaster planci]
MAIPTVPNFQPWGALPISQVHCQVYGTKRKATFTECGTTSEQITTVKKHCLHPSTHLLHPVGHSQPSPWQRDEASAASSQPDCLSANSSQELFQTAFPQPAAVQPEGADIVQSPNALPPTQNFHNSDMHSQTPCDMDTAMTTSGMSANSQSETSYTDTWKQQTSSQCLCEQPNQNRLNMLEEVEFESNDYWDVPYDHHLLKMANEIEQARIAMETEEAPCCHQPGLPTTEPTLIPASVPLEIHSTGSHVRCYCKPCWEGLLEPVSYI